MIPEGGHAIINSLDVAFTSEAQFLVFGIAYCVGPFWYVLPFTVSTYKLYAAILFWVLLIVA